MAKEARKACEEAASKAKEERGSQDAAIETKKASKEAVKKAKEAILILQHWYENFKMSPFHGLVDFNFQGQVAAV